MGAGDGDDPAAGHHRRRAPAERGSIRRPRATRLDVLGVVLAGRGRDDERVGVADVVGVVAEVHRRAEVAQRVEGRRVVVVAAADRRCPRASMIRAIAGQPGAADADEVHAAEAVGREHLVGDAGPSSAGLQHDPGQLLVGVARDQRRGRRAHRGQPLGVGGQAGTCRGDPRRR